MVGFAEKKIKLAKLKGSVVLEGLYYSAKLGGFVFWKLQNEKKNMRKGGELCKKRQN